MGDELGAATFTLADRRRFREKARRNLDALAAMLDERRFEADERSIGLEIELNLCDPESRPALANAEVLDRIADDAFQTELGRFNLEVNVPPRLLGGGALRGLEAGERASLDRAEAHARDAGARLLLIGILPTLRPELLEQHQAISP